MIAMLDIGRRDYAPKILKKIHGAQNEEIAGLNYEGPLKLYHELLDRSANVGELLARNKRALAFETMYGIALGIDGLQSHWGVHKSTGSGFAEDDDGVRQIPVFV